MATITVNGSASATVVAGTTVNVAVTAGPGNKTDWVALAPVGSPNTTFLNWAYLNGNKTPPTVGLKAATVKLVAPSVGGNYEARFLANDGFTVIAKCSVVVPLATINVNNETNPTVPAATSVAVIVSGGPGNPSDWVGFASAGSPSNVFLDWKYLNDSKTLPTTSVKDATVHLMTPSAPGQCEARFFLNNGFSILARASFSVGSVLPLPPKLVSIQLNPTSLSVNGSNNANMVVGAVSVITDPPGGDTSKVALSLTGVDASKFVLSSPSLPSSVKVGAANIPAGTPSAPTKYTVTISADMP